MFWLALVIGMAVGACMGALALALVAMSGDRQLKKTLKS
ncbi:putative membrane protein [Bradyrhizobium japonicum]